MIQIDKTVTATISGEDFETLSDICEIIRVVLSENRGRFSYMRGNGQGDKIDQFLESIFGA